MTSGCPSDVTESDRDRRRMIVHSTSSSRDIQVYPSTYKYSSSTSLAVINALCSNYYPDLKEYKWGKRSKHLSDSDELDIATKTKSKKKKNLISMSKQVLLKARQQLGIFCAYFNYHCHVK